MGFTGPPVGSVATISPEVPTATSVVMCFIRPLISIRCPTKGSRLRLRSALTLQLERLTAAQV